MSCFSSLYNTRPKMTEITKHYKSSDSRLKGGQPGMNPNTSTWWEEQAGSQDKKKKNPWMSPQKFISCFWELYFMYEFLLICMRKSFIRLFVFSQRAGRVIRGQRRSKWRSSRQVFTLQATPSINHFISRESRSPQKKHFCWGKMAVEGFQISTSFIRFYC